jgi:hypothetical protein
LSVEFRKCAFLAGRHEKRAPTVDEDILEKSVVVALAHTSVEILTGHGLPNPNEIADRALV